ncbi:MAG: TIGR02147 family protein [Pseudobdellovibrionaceae bacterium]
MNLRAQAQGLSRITLFLNLLPFDLVKRYTNPMNLHYRETLKQEYDERRIRNPSYSLRAFARDLDLAPSKLSEIIRGKVGLSRAKAEHISVVLDLDSASKDLFICSVEKEHSRSPMLRETAKIRMSVFTSRLQLTKVDLEKFKILSDWYHFAIMELTIREDFVSDPVWISQKLEISKEVTYEAIKRLENFGLIKKDKKGRWLQTETDLAVGNCLPSSAIRKHHRQILDKAEKSLENCPTEQREFSSNIFVVDESQIPNAKKALKELRRAFCSDFTKSKTKNRVYCLALQFFPIDKK